MTRYALMIGLLAAVGLQSLPWEEPGASVAGRGVPDSVRAAAAEGRYWRATRLLEDYMAGAADTAPSTLLLSARLNAGWGEWSAVVQALEGRPWLDSLDGGAGWGLLGRARLAHGAEEAGVDALARYLEVAELDATARGTAELRLGLAQTRMDSTEAARAAFRRARALMPWFADWTSYFAAEAAARAGDLDGVNRLLAEAGEVGRGSWRLRVAAAVMADDDMAAREVALAATRTGSRAERSAAWAELGRLRLAAGEEARARDAFGRAMEVRGSAGAVEAARRLSELDPRPGEWRQIAEVYQWHGNASRAADAYERYLASGEGTGGERAGVQLRLGRARFAAGHYIQAERGLKVLAESDVPDRIAAEALYLLARAQYRQGRSTAGEATFVQLAERYPREAAAARGLFLLADLKHDDLETEGPAGARALYRRAADASPDLNEAGLSMMRLGGLAFLDGDYLGAAETWKEYLDRHPDGRRSTQATYWLARAHWERGDHARAKALLWELRREDPLSFYGMRAAEELGESILSLSMAPPPPRDARSDSLVRDRLRRVDVLAELERREDLVTEVERLRRRFQAASDSGALAGEYALAEALNERGYTLTGIGMGWDLYERSEEWNPRLLRIVYPFPYHTLVVLEARDQGLDPYVVAGLIRQESAFSPVVVSGAGAVGLMQILPSTARVLARGAGVTSFEPGLLTRPELNIHLGTRFLVELLDRFGHELPLVLAAYNAGPTRAATWRTMPEARDPELFTERIPYGETRDYVRRVLLHRAIYQALYPELRDEAGPAPTTPAAGSILP